MAGSTGIPISAVNPCRSRSCNGNLGRQAFSRRAAAHLRHGDRWHPVGALAAALLRSHEMHLDLEMLMHLTKAEKRDFSVLRIS